MKILILCLLLLLIVFLLIYFLSKKGNPSSDTWFVRSDGSGTNEFGKDGNYLVQTIFPEKPYGPCPCEPMKGTCRDGQCYSYSNAEIYNNPCCRSGVDAYCDKNPDDLVCMGIEGACKDDWSDGSCKMYRSVVGDPWANSVKNYIKSGFLNTPYRYWTMKTKIRAKNMIGGSRGWGFWNTLPKLSDNIIIWFMQQQGILESGQDYQLNGFYAQIISPNNKPVFVKLPDLDEDWHTYEIVWKADSITMKIDDNVVLQQTENIPDGYTALHVWVDNAVFGQTSDGLFEHINQVITEPRNQEIEYLHIYPSE